MIINVSLIVIFLINLTLRVNAYQNVQMIILIVMKIFAKMNLVKKENFMIYFIKNVSINVIQLIIILIKKQIFV